MNDRKLRQALCYTSEGHLDLSWCLAAAALIIGIVAFFGEATGRLKPSPEGWAFLGGFVLALLICGAARDRASILAKATSPGSLAKGIASAVPNLFTDDERGSVGQ